MSGSDFVDRLLARAAALNVAISETQAHQLERYYDLLRRWNRRINLTALPLDVPPGDDTLDRLFSESLIAAQFVDDQPADWLDVGSGGGSPAIPLKIVRPELNLTMIEARERKAAFLREAVRDLGLMNSVRSVAGSGFSRTAKDVAVLTERVEALAEARPGSADIITVRAVRADAVLLRRFADLLRPAGRLITFGSSSVPDGFDLVQQRPLPSPGSFVSLLRVQSGRRSFR